MLATQFERLVKYFASWILPIVSSCSRDYDSLSGQAFGISYKTLWSIVQAMPILFSSCDKRDFPFFRFEKVWLTREDFKKIRVYML